MKCVQLRSSIFIAGNFGYSPDTEKEFKEILLKNSRAFGLPPSGAFSPFIEAPLQYGMPWRLSADYNGSRETLIFLPGKIDFIRDQETTLGSAETKHFIEETVRIFKELLKRDSVGTISRIAFAPLFSISLDTESNFWQRLLRFTALSGKQLKDINFNFLLKDKFKVGKKEIEMNYLNQFYDGIHLKESDGNKETEKVVLFQLDINSVPEINIKFSEEETGIFFKEMPEKASELLAELM